MHGGDIYTYNGMLDFSVNINPLGMSEKVSQAAKRGIDLSAAYPDIKCRKLKAALSDRLAVPEDLILIGNGAADLIYSAVSVQRPGKALIPVPAFTEYESALRAAGWDCSFAETFEKDGFTAGKGFEEKIGEDIDLLFLCSPANPSGRQTDRNLLLRIIKRCMELGVRVILDECFIEFAEEGENMSLVSVTGDFPCLTVIRAFTKIHAMAGLRLGYAVSGDRELIKKMESSRQPWSISIPAQEAGLAALTETGRVIETRRLVKEQRGIMEKELCRLGFRAVKSDVNYILFYSEEDLFHELLKRKILIRDCSDYRGLGPGWYRTAVRTGEENQILLTALRQIVKNER